MKKLRLSFVDERALSTVARATQENRKLSLRKKYRYLRNIVKEVDLYDMWVSGQLPQRKIAPWSDLGFGLGSALRVGLGGNFLRGQLP